LSFQGRITSPLTPLQPVLFRKPELFLAGEGSLRERGLRPLSETLPVATGRLRGASATLSDFIPLLWKRRGIQGEDLKNLFFSLPPLQTGQSRPSYSLLFGEGDKGVRL
jgi:hypothetical protein